MSDPLHPYRALSTSAISDALDSLGLDGCLPGLFPQVQGTSCMGPAFTVTYVPMEDRGPGFRNASNYIDEVPEGAVVVIDNQGKDNCTVWGDILTDYAVRKGLGGTLIFGAARDIQQIRALQYPLFSSHIYMRSGKNRVTKSEIGGPLRIAGVAIQPGDLIVADDNGCVCVPAKHAETVLARALRIETTEARIREAVATGMELQEARRQFGYHAPWEEQQSAP